jgi:hypothetical protein
MSTSGHPHTGRGVQPTSLEQRRHECYRQLARAILGPGAPQHDADLARALAEHASLLRAPDNVTPIRRRRVA